MHPLFTNSRADLSWTMRPHRYYSSRRKKLLLYESPAGVQNPDIYKPSPSPLPTLVESLFSFSSSVHHPGIVQSMSP